jgi:hypothetical protein
LLIPTTVKHSVISVGYGKDSQLLR